MHRTNAMLLVSFDDLQGRKAKSCKRLRDQMGKFVMFILISIVYFGIVQRLNIKRNLFNPT